MDFAGPLNYKVQEYNGSLPELVVNPYSWTKVKIFSTSSNFLLLFLLPRLYTLTEMIEYVAGI